MIEYIQNTGFYSSQESYYNLGQISNGIGSINSQNVLVNDVYLNGQTLLENEPDITVVAQREIVSHTGDFFLSNSLLRSSTGFTDLSLFDRESNLKHDFIESGAHPFFYSSGHTELITGFSGAAGDLAGDYVFLNGAKLVSGEDYVENSNGNFDYIGLTEETGCLFAMPIKDGFYTSGLYDLTGLSFNIGTTVGFLNGMRVDENELLETSSLLLDLINTGLDSTVEFKISVTPQTVLF